MNLQENIKRILREETSDQTQMIKNILELTVMKDYEDLICDIIVAKTDDPRYKYMMNYYGYVLEFIFLRERDERRISDYDIHLQIMNDTSLLLFDYTNISVYVKGTYVKQCD